ncbi:MAG TPA: histidine kinase, partial [Chitinophagaceae bacterium]|nr:histidine kinase [Chitinophagaceae bacterium]
MEYDNDRPVKSAYKIVLFYWVLLGIINPLVNSFTLFWHEPRMWVVLFVVSLVTLPAYILYSEIVPGFLFQRRYVAFFLISVVYFATIQVLLFAVYSVILKFPVAPENRPYFTYNYITIIRECLWTFINMSLAVGIFFIKKALDEKAILLGLEKDNKDFKLKYLRAQLNPHFLFNTLNSIYSLSLQKSDKTPEVVVKLADLMRYMIYECGEEKVPLRKEIEFIKNYIEIEKIRYKADVRLTVEGDTDGIMVEPFLFISFIENGFKHAFDNTYSNAFIYITIKAEKEQVTLSVVNNTNLELEMQAKRIHGTGIKNSKSILELLYPAS